MKQTSKANISVALFAAVLGAAVSCSRSTASDAGAAPAGFLRASASPEVVVAEEAQAPRPEPTGVPSPELVAAASTPSSQARGAGSGASPSERAPANTGSEQEAQAALESGDSGRAAAIYSDLLLAAVRGPGPDDRHGLARWTAALERAQAGHRWSRRGPWPSVEVTVQPGDSLTAVRKRVLAQYSSLLVCTGLIARANQLTDERAIHPGDVLRIPTDRASVLVDLGALWAFYLHADQVVAAWEVGIGRDGKATRPGSYTIGLKQREPMWFPAGRAPVPFGDPDNPLGTRWMAWFEGGRNTSLGFHGTSDPVGIGARVSDGCIRMRNADVEALFEVLPEGAAVVVQP